jgi:hypothetical protein
VLGQIVNGETSNAGAAQVRPPGTRTVVPRQCHHTPLVPVRKRGSTSASNHPPSHTLTPDGPGRRSCHLPHSELRGGHRGCRAVRRTPCSAP